MAQRATVELADCSELRQTLLARPPAIVHGTVLLCILVLAAAVGWAALVQVSIVVRTPGRVRPIEQPALVFAERGSYLDGRVAEVFVAEGDRVTAGQTLIRIDTKRLDNEIAKLKRKAAALRAELAELGQLEQLMTSQFESVEARAKAKICLAEAELQRAIRQRASRIRAAEAEFEAAADAVKRLERLGGSEIQAVAPAEFVKVKSQSAQAYERLVQARLPIDDGQLEVLRRAMENDKSDYAVRCSELATRQVAKRAEAAAVEAELASLLMERNRAELRAPVDGVVVSGHVRAGDVLELGSPVFEIARQDGFQFVSAVPSRDVGQLRVGMPATIKFDAYDFQDYGALEGVVCFVSPDSDVSATEGTPSGAVHYIVRVQLQGQALESRGIRADVKLGLGGVAEIIVQRESLLATFFKKVRGTMSLG